MSQAEAPTISAVRFKILVQVKCKLFSKMLCESLHAVIPGALCEEGSGSGFAEDIRRCRPEIVLIEADDPVRCTVLREIKKHPFHVKILAILPPETLPAVKVRYLMDGLDGYVRSNDPPEVLIRAIVAGHADQIWAERSIIAMALRTAISKKRRHGDLSQREREVMMLSSTGLKPREVAEIMCLSLSAVKSHLQRTYRKFGVKGKAEAIRQFTAEESVK